MNAASAVADPSPMSKTLSSWSEAVQVQWTFESDDVTDLLLDARAVSLPVGYPVIDGWLSAATTRSQFKADEVIDMLSEVAALVVVAEAERQDQDPTAE